MEYYARISNGIVMEVIELEPGQDITQIFNPALAWVPCSSSTVQGMIYSNGVFSNPPEPAPPTALQLAQAAFASAMASGCQIVSTSTPAFNATYPLDNTTLLKMSGVQSNIFLTQSQPGGPTFLNGATTQLWWDLYGLIHVIPSPAFFTAFAKAIAQYIEDLTTALMNVQNGGSWATPAQPVTIP